MEGQDAITLETSQYHIPHRDDQCPNSIFERLEFGADWLARVCMHSIGAGVLVQKEAKRADG